MPPIARIVSCFDGARTGGADLRPVPTRLYLVLPAGARPQGPATLTNLRAMRTDGWLSAVPLLSAKGSNGWGLLAELLADRLPNQVDASIPSNKLDSV